MEEQSKPRVFRGQWVLMRKKNAEGRRNFEARCQRRKDVRQYIQGLSGIIREKVWLGGSLLARGGEICSAQTVFLASRYCRLADLISGPRKARDIMFCPYNGHLQTLLLSSTITQPWSSTLSTPGFFMGESRTR